MQKFYSLRISTAIVPPCGGHVRADVCYVILRSISSCILRFDSFIPIGSLPPLPLWSDCSTSSLIPEHPHLEVTVQLQPLSRIPFRSELTGFF